MSKTDNASLHIQVSRELNSRESFRINSLLVKARRRIAHREGSGHLQVVIDFSHNQTVDALGVAFMINLIRHADSQTSYEFIGMSSWLRQELKVLKLSPKGQGFTLRGIPSLQAA